MLATGGKFAALLVEHEACHMLKSVDTLSYTALCKWSHTMNTSTYIVYYDCELRLSIAVSRSCFSAFIAVISCSSSGLLVRPNSLTLLRTLCNASLADDRFPRDSFFLDKSRRAQIFLQAEFQLTNNSKKDLV